MSAMTRVLQWQQAARTRRVLIVLMMALPLILAVLLLASRFFSTPLLVLTTLASISALAWSIWNSIKIFDTPWLIRQLDQGLSHLEDSSDLLFKQSSTFSSLQTLQCQRVEQRVLNLNKVDLREDWPWGKIALACLLSLSLGGFAYFWPDASVRPAYRFDHDLPKPPAKASPIVLVEKTLSIQAPAYTGLGRRSENELQVKFPEGAKLNWQLKFQAQAESVVLLFHDGSRLALQKKGETWQGSRVMLQSSLYRLQVNNAPLAKDKLYRLDAIKDLPPQLQVLQPDRNLSLVQSGQTSWRLSFAAEDEYGLGAAQLRIQLAQGSGENIKFSELTRNLAGQGARTRKRFAQQLDLNSLGLKPGDDVIIQFSISDQRSPQSNTTRSSSFILRWPPEDSVQATGVEGMVQKAIPAYFRSQRQIIIDSEKLLAEKSKLTTEKFAIQSDIIGVDQRILRLRYGQFLGEEAEDEHEEHDDAAPGKAATANDAQSILEQYGHTHDIPEAATLLDPGTKKLLRAALNEMWQAELHLRQAEPGKALPYEYRALAFIKKVQQADRIYLARVGLELAPVDETRRLSGDRSSLKNRNDFLQAAVVEDLALIKFWQALDQLELGIRINSADPPDFKALRHWIREHPTRSPDALGLLAALDALEKQPKCKACLAEMKTQLWPMLPKPPASPRQRILSDPSAQKYLDALQQERKP